MKLLSYRKRLFSIIAFAFIITIGLFSYFEGRYFLLALVIKSDSKNKNKYITYLTTEKANWEYIINNFGSMKARVSKSQNGVKIDFDFNFEEATELNSMHCVRDVPHKIQNNTISVSIRYCLCNDWGATTDLSIMLHDLKTGEYQIHYDDRNANFPIIGKIKL